MQPHFFNVNVNWNSERKGIMCSPELDFSTGPGRCIEVATPPQFPKGIQGIWSPEHLFTASVASCFMTTFLAISDKARLRFKAFTCHAKGKMDEIDSKLAMSDIHLFPTVILYNENDRDRALKVLSKTENSCLITNSIKSRVVMHPSIRITAEALKP